MRLTRSVTAAFVLLVALEGGCRRSGCSAEWVSTVFVNFVYVGQFPDNRKVPIPIHGQEAQRFPRQLQKETAYIFHSKGPVSAEAAAIHDLPERLKIAGVQVIGEPKNAGDFGIPNSGGPIWNINFASNTCSGEIYDTVDPSLYHDRASWPDGSLEDYVLVFSK